MITDEEIEQLPEDPELAFVEFERIMRDRTNVAIERTPYDNEGTSLIESYRLEYINKVVGAARVYNIDGLKQSQVPRMDANVYEEWRQFMSDVDYVTIQIRIRHAPHNRQNSVGLDGNTKAKIHGYVQKIRIVLDKAELPEPKRDLLFAKLDAFVIEVDKARTSIQPLASAWLSVCTYIGEGFNKLEPARRFLDSIGALMGKAKEAEEALRMVSLTTGQLEPPRRQLPAPDDVIPAADEDEIPF